MLTIDLTTAMTNAVMTLQQLRQAYDAALEELAVLKAQPTVLPGFVVLTPAEVAALTNSSSALADATAANALAATPAGP